MGNSVLKKTALNVLRAMETASDRLFGRLEQLEESVMAVSEPLFDVGDWSVGRTCRELDPGAELSAATISQVSRDMLQLKHIIRLAQALSTSASELLELHELRMKPVSLKLSRGLDSLPDDILASIFNLATIHEQQKGTQYAIWLSHVSRRFREVCLGDHRMWSTVRFCGGVVKDCIDDCIRRSGKDADLHVILNYNNAVDSDALRQFSSTCLTRASRWKTLTLTNDWEGGDDRALINTQLTQLMQLEGRSLAFPRLEELSLSQCECSYWFRGRDPEPLWSMSPGNELFNVHPWETPSLRVLRCVQYIPPPSFPFSSYTTFSLSLFLVPDDLPAQVQELVRFFSSQRNITTFDLNLKSHGYELDDEFPLPRIEVHPNVTTFRFRVLDIHFYQDKLTCPFWSLLRIPALENMVLTIDDSSGWDSESISWVGGKSAVLMEAGDLFPDFNEHPRLTSLTVQTTAPRTEGRKSTPKSVSITLNIPLNKVPQVAKLRVTTFCEVTFAPSKSTKSNLMEEGAETTHLQEVQFYFCENLNAEHLGKTVQSLKDADAWEALERVIVKGCDLLDYNLALEVIGEERLRFES